MSTREKMSRNPRLHLIRGVNMVLSKKKKKKGQHHHAQGKMRLHGLSKALFVTTCCISESYNNLYCFS